RSIRLSTSHRARWLHRHDQRNCARFSGAALSRGNVELAAMENEKIYLTEEELVERWRGVVSAGTLRNWRSLSSRKAGADSPPYMKIGKSILYGPKEALEAWERGHLK